MVLRLLSSRSAKMAPDADHDKIHVEAVLSRLNLEEKISLLAG